jgi:NAD(P)-dependent dehydrogenase (short-subunit alcohol dehydrogenase family)
MLTPHANRFKDKIVAITGGAAGIGRSIAHRISMEGGTSVLLDRDGGMLAETSSEFKRENLAVATRKMDVSSADSVREAFAWIGNEFGRVDAVVNCAGITGPTAVKITDYSVEAFDQVCQVNLRGSFLVTRNALELMTKANRGRILLIASIAGKEGNPGMCGYSASKAGVVGLVKAIGKEFAETGITINGLAPAVIRTALVDGVAPEQVKYMTDKIPMKRCGTLDEVASMSAWIVSDENSFTTGFVFDLSGGRATY